MARTWGRYQLKGAILYTKSAIEAMTCKRLVYTKYCTSVYSLIKSDKNLTHKFFIAHSVWGLYGLNSRQTDNRSSASHPARIGKEGLNVYGISGLSSEINVETVNWF